MFRVLSAQIAHETNTFSVKETTLADYHSRSLYFGAEIPAAFQGTNTEIGAHLSASLQYGWEMSQPVACSATPSGPTTTPVWLQLRDELLGAAESHHFDGAVVALHGAMVTEDEDDAEGALLEGLRSRLGSHIPIVATVDLHANVSDLMAQNCNALLAYRTYPHVDQHDVALEACALLQSQMESRKLFSAHVWRLPTLSGCDFGRTDGTVMPRLLELCGELRSADKRCKAAEVCAGFPWADVWFAGPSLVVTWSGREDPPDELIRPILDAMWETRKEASVRYTKLSEAVAIAQTWNGRLPLVLADAADNPGAGGYGDSVSILRELIAAKVEGVAMAAVADPFTAAKAVAAGPGATIEMKLGGLHEPKRYGGPLHCKGRVINTSDGSLKLSGKMMHGLELSLGPSAVVEIGGVHVIVATNNMQIFDRSFFLNLGVDPHTMRVLVLKSSHHFRSDFGELAGRILLVDAGGPVSPNLTRLAYRKLRKPIEPFDRADWH